MIVNDPTSVPSTDSNVKRAGIGNATATPKSTTLARCRAMAEFFLMKACRTEASIANAPANMPYETKPYNAPNGGSG